MDRSELTLRLPREQIEKAERYAAAHHTTLDEIVSRALDDLSIEADEVVHERVRGISGILPENLPDPKGEYHDYLLKKHQ